MAEGGDLASIKDGSDADFEIVCTPCGYDDIREEAVKYCPECEEYLCIKCTKQHGRRKASISHKLLDRDAAKQGHVAVLTTKCRYHSDRDIEMYCGAHDMVYCTKCIATEHRSCAGVTGIEDIPISPDKQREMQSLNDDIRNIQERLEAIDEMTQKNMDVIEKQKADIVVRIEEIERILVEHIGKLKREAISAVNENYSAITHDLESNATMLANMKTEVGKLSNQMQTVISFDAGQQFVQMKLMQKTVKDATKMYEESEVKGRQALCFAENTKLMTFIKEATSLGKMTTTAEDMLEPRQYKVKSKKNINVRMQNDKSICYVCDVCQLPDGTFILADQNNKKIKRLDVNHKVRDYCDLSTYPMGICCTGQNEVAVKMQNSKVQFIAIGSSLSKMREISVSGGCYWGMAYCAGELWISEGKSVGVYSISGSLMKTIVIKDAKGMDIFKSSTQQVAVCGDTVIVADNSDGAVVLRKDDRAKRELRDGKLVNTMGVCVSNDGTVFLSGRSSNNIVMFDRNGKFFGELVVKDADLITPLSLYYDDKSNQLFVTCASCNNIILFDI